MLAALAVPAFRVPHPPPRPARSLESECSRCSSAVMNAEEEEARRRWLSARESSTPLPSTPRITKEEEEAMRKAARERMLQAMGGAGNPSLNDGLGAQFGFGAPDDEDYGYGPPKAADPRAELYDEGAVDLPTWLTQDPVGAKDYMRKVDEGFIKGDDSAKGNGFDGRPLAWKRRAEMLDPNPPPVENTLRGPAPDAKPAQAFTMDFRAAQEDIAKADEAEAQEQEDALLNALTGMTDDEEEAKKRRKLEEDAQNRPWNAP